MYSHVVANGLAMCHFIYMYINLVIKVKIRILQIAKVEFLSVLSNNVIILITSITMVLTLVTWPSLKVKFNSVSDMKRRNCH